LTHTINSLKKKVVAALDDDIKDWSTLLLTPRELQKGGTPKKLFIFGSPKPIPIGK